MFSDHLTARRRHYITRAVLCVAVSTLGLGLLAAEKATLISFDIPGSGTKPGQGTVAATIADLGAVTGCYVDGENVGHGFLRAPDGRVTTIDAPGAGSKADPQCSFPAPTGVPVAQGTYAANINLVGAVAGFYVDAHCVAHGFLRARDGAFITVDAPKAGNEPGQGTLLLNVNLTYGERLRAISSTPMAPSTPSCALPTAGSPRSMFRARSQGRARERGPVFLVLARRAPSRDGMWTRTT